VDKFHKWSRTAALFDVYYKRFLSFAQEDIMRPIKLNKASLRVLMRRWTSIAITLLVLVLALSGCAAETPSTLNPASDGAGEIASLFYLVLAIAVVVFVLVEGLLIYAVFRYRRRDGEDEEPEQIHGNAKLEILWTVIPAIIMVVLFVLTLRTLQAQQNVPEDAVVIDVRGQQWSWRFSYSSPEPEVFTTNKLYIPVGKPVLFRLESSDVIHSFWIPQLSGKRDVIPGRRNELWLQANTPGTYLGECAEFCGREHYAMLFEVIALPEDEFRAELQAIFDAQGNALCPDQEPCEDVVDVGELPEGTPSEGQPQYDELGCKSCHSLDGSVLVGPSFQGLGQRAEGRSAEESAQQYLAHSILRPHDFLVPGFQPVMPENFGQLLTADELADLIAFLMEQ
jgi:cytochrome c oxidase subunit II